MRDILFLTHRIPYPLNKGEKIRAWHMLRYLQTLARVHLGCFIDHRDDRRHAGTVATGCAGAYLPSIRPRLAALRSLQGLATGEALSVRYYRHRSMHQWVRHTLDRHDIGAVIAYSGPMAQYVPAAGNAPLLTVMDLVDVDSEKWRAYGDAGPWSAVYRREARRLLDWERRVAQRVDHTLLVSQTEADLFRRLAPESAHKTGHLNLGVDCDWYCPALRLDNPYRGCPDNVRLVFTGALDYRPNIEAVEWFARRVLPLLQERHRDLQFHIVGLRPAPRVLALRGTAGVAVHASVPDVRPYLQHAALAVAPLQLARGVQTKVLEAMAMQKVVVVTPQALEGITAIAQHELLVAADAGQFAVRILDALDRPHAMLEMGHRARQRVQRDYHWQTNLQRLGALLHAAPSMAAERSA